MQSTRKARWQQATALVSLSTAGAMTGFSVAHGTVTDLTSPASVPVKLLASRQPATPAAGGDRALRSAIVKAAQYYLRLAQSRSPSEIEALIWQNDSTDGADHGESCAAFASLTLEAGAQATGHQSWVTGGTTYPWPVHAWVDSRVDPNPASPDVMSILQDAQAHQRWHPLGDGYTPQPGDWVLFDGHVEVVTKDAGGVLYTIGGDSMPNLSVNAHQYSAPLAAQGVTGFVNNGVLVSAVSQTSGGGQETAPAQGVQDAAQAAPDQGQAELPGLVMPALSLGGTAQAGGQAQQDTAGSAAAKNALTSTASIPGEMAITGSVTSFSAATSSPRYSRSPAGPGVAPALGSAAQQAFINAIAPGALAAQRQYGIPAAVTIAQAIDESAWGQSQLATQDNNLFGIKGTGPAGSVVVPTQEYENGQPVTVNAPFRVYGDVAQSISDHSLLLASGSAYQQAMADRRSPDAFANDLTGVYATDPDYGANLITIMRQYNLYRFDAGTPAAQPTAAASGSAPSGPAPSGPAPSGSGPGSMAQQASGPNVTGLGASGHGASESDLEGSGAASIPGLDAYAGAAATAFPGAGTTGARPQPADGQMLRAGPRNLRVSTRRYVAQMPRIVTTDFMATAKTPLLRAKPLYQDVAGDSGIRWELLAACDWMQCQAQPRVSPVHGEKLGSKNPDGTVYRTKSEALEQVAADLLELAALVYGINLRQRLILSVRDLANVFAAFRWGGLLKSHRISAMEFPYSVEGLTAQHLKMRWPDIGEDAPDKPGKRFRRSFGAVPVVLGLSYPAIA
ncbi:MAG TPA: glycoside hydrolase family 73 protein [Streptosporangiaceae bacterium]|nr:glycoside hydrolase family 73 protein [Streptosporangiaceae bacterium]